MSREKEILSIVKIRKLIIIKAMSKKFTENTHQVQKFLKNSEVIVVLHLFEIVIKLVELHKNM